MFPFALPFLGVFKKVSWFEWLLIGILVALGIFYAIKSHRLDKAESDLVVSNVTLGITTKERDIIDATRTIDDAITTKTLSQIETYRDASKAESKEFLNDYLKLVPPAATPTAPDSSVAVLVQPSTGDRTDATPQPPATKTTPAKTEARPVVPAVAQAHAISADDSDRLRVKLIATRLQHAATCAASDIPSDCPASPFSPAVQGSPSPDGSGTPDSTNTVPGDHG